MIIIIKIILFVFLLSLLAFFFFAGFLASFFLGFAFSFLPSFFLGAAFFVGFFWTAVLDVFLEESVALAWEGVFIQSNATTNTASAVMKLCLPQKSILPNP